MKKVLALPTLGTLQGLSGIKTCLGWRTIDAEMRHKTFAQRGKCRVTTVGTTKKRSTFFRVSRTSFGLRTDKAFGWGQADLLPLGVDVATANDPNGFIRRGLLEPEIAST